MKRRRKFELLLADLWRLLADPERAKRDFALSLAVWNLSDFTEELARDATKTRQLLEFGRALQSSDAPGRQVAEERLLENLIYLAGKCCDSLEDGGLSRLPEIQAVTGAAPEFQPVLQVVRVLHDYALGCFEFKRPRDSFGGRRRAIAFEILARISSVVDLPEVVRLAQQALRKVQSVEGRQAAQFLEDYFGERDLLPDDAMTEDLLSLAERTESRSTAFQALNALVKAGTISEFEALDRMDDWKSKHR